MLYNAILGLQSEDSGVNSFNTAAATTAYSEVTCSDLYVQEAQPCAASPSNITRGHRTTVDPASIPYCSFACS